MHLRFTLKSKSKTARSICTAMVPLVVSILALLHDHLQNLHSNYGSTQPSNRSLPCSNMHPDSCPPGLFCVDGRCECGVYPFNDITCNGTDSFTLQYYCVTFDREQQVISVRACIRKWNKSRLKVPLPVIHCITNYQKM